MYYGIVAPGISRVYDNYEPIRRLKALYPYCKFRKFYSEDDAYAFIRRYSNNYELSTVNKYGDTFDNLCVDMDYIIRDDKVYYNFHTKGIGVIKLYSEDAIIDNRAEVIMVMKSGFKLNPDMIQSHLVAIYHGIELLGEYIDVNIKVPNCSIYYALMSYTGSNRVIQRVVDKINNRLGNISITLDFKMEEYDEEI